MLGKREQELNKQREQQVREMADEKTAGRSGTSGGSRRQGVAEAFAKSVARAIGSTLGRQIVRGILGSIIGRR
jgi:hypothetical protein